MPGHRVRIGEGGEIVIPAAYRTALGTKAGDELVIRLEAGELRLVPQNEALNRIRSAMSAGQEDRPGNHTDEFLAWRRRDS